MDGTAPLAAGCWVHVTVTKSALVGTLYVDGVQSARTRTSASTRPGLGNTPDNWIGRSQNPADLYLAGLVTDLRIYQRGLTETEITDFL